MAFFLLETAQAFIFDYYYNEKQGQMQTEKGKRWGRGEVDISREEWYTIQNAGKNFRKP